MDDVIDDVSYYSDDESVCLGLTFTHNNKVAQSTTNSTDSGVECTQICDKTIVELSNTSVDADLNPKCDTDSGCDVKHELYLDNNNNPDNNPSNTEEIYPGLSESEMLKARMKKLGGVEGGQVAALNARSLDILNGKFEGAGGGGEAQHRFQRSQPDTRRDKRKCNRIPTPHLLPPPLRLDKKERIIYENVSEYENLPRRNPVYVNYRPIKYNTPQKGKRTTAPLSSHPSTAALSTAPLSPHSAPVPLLDLSSLPCGRKYTQPQQESKVQYNTPIRRNYFGRAGKKLSPHHYELIRSPDPSPPHTSTSTCTIPNTTSTSTIPPLSPSSAQSTVSPASLSPRHRYQPGSTVCNRGNNACNRGNNACNRGNNGQYLNLSNNGQYLNLSNNDTYLEPSSWSEDRTLSPGEVNPYHTRKNRAPSPATAHHRAPSPGYKRGPLSTHSSELRNGYVSDMSVDENIRSYHEAVRSNKAYNNGSLHNGSLHNGSFSGSLQHENPLYSNSRSPTPDLLLSRKHATRSPVSRKNSKSPVRNSRNSPVRNSRNSPVRKTPKLPIRTLPMHQDDDRELYVDTLTTRSPRKRRESDKQERGEWRESDKQERGEWRESDRQERGGAPLKEVEYDIVHDDTYDRYDLSPPLSPSPPHNGVGGPEYANERIEEDWSMDNAQRYSTGMCTTCSSAYSSSPDFALSSESDMDYRPAAAPGRCSRHTKKQTHKRKVNSRFRYSTSNIKSSPERGPDNEVEEEEEEESRRGIVLLQVSLDDIHSLHRLNNDIFELRFVDSGLTSDIIHMLGDLCRTKNTSRLIFEDCELDDWNLFCKVMNITNISHIRFVNCNVGDGGMVYISQLINSAPCVTSLTLHKCRIRCAGIAALGVALMQNNTLQHLDISDNEFLTKGAVLFFRALKGGNSSICHLNLSDTCCGATDVVMMICALLLRNTRLAHVNLNNTGLTDDGVTLIAESISHNTHLNSLCISENGLKDASAHEIAVTLADYNSLLHIDLSDNLLTHAGLNVLIQSVTVRKTIRLLNLTGNLSQRQDKTFKQNTNNLIKLVEDLALCGVIVL